MIKRIVGLFVLVAAFQMVLAQSAQVQKLGKSVFTLTTFKKDGSILSSAKGVFVGNKGEAVSLWTPFVGADSAIVIDASGKKMEVEVLYGANELYDVCKFRVAGTTVAAPLADKALVAGAKAWLVEYSTTKTKPTQVVVKNAETFMGNYHYYTYQGDYAALQAGSPVANANGEVVGLLQLSKVSSEGHSTDVRFINTFQTNGLSINDAVLNQAHIRVALPEQLDMATVMLMLAESQGNAKRHQQYVTEFMQRFPHALEGYLAQARIHVMKAEYVQASSVMEKALASVDNKSDVHYHHALLIYQKSVSMGLPEYAPWTLDAAMKELGKALALKQQPMYEHLKARILYAQGQYQEAYNLLMSLTKTTYRSGELFYEASQAKKQLQGSDEEILALLDSAIAAQEVHLSAPYVLARGMALYDGKQYRRAIQDFNRYDTLMAGRGSHDFYYLKFHAEVQAKQYQPALNDIAHAIILNRNEPTYYVEMAQLQLRVNMPDDALRTIDLCLQIAPDYPEAYLIQGLAYIEKKQKADGLNAFRKAKELGSEQADALIEKYK